MLGLGGRAAAALGHALGRADARPARGAARLPRAAPGAPRAGRTGGVRPPAPPRARRGVGPRAGDRTAVPAPFPARALDELPLLWCGSSGLGVRRRRCRVPASAPVRAARHSTPGASVRQLIKGSVVRRCPTAADVEDREPVGGYPFNSPRFGSFFGMWRAVTDLACFATRAHSRERLLALLSGAFPASLQFRLQNASIRTLQSTGQLLASSPMLLYVPSIHCFRAMAILLGATGSTFAVYRKHMSKAGRQRCTV